MDALGRKTKGNGQLSLRRAPRRLLPSGKLSAVVGLMEYSPVGLRSGYCSALS